MNITSIYTTPLLCKFKQPYHWAQGVNYYAPIILIEIETDSGIVGIGESVASPTLEPVHAIIRDAIPHFVGKSAYDGFRLIADYYRFAFNARGTGSAPRYFAQAMTGIDLALWDAIGKAAGQPLHRLLGGAVRDEVRYFGFVQGDKPEEVAAHAKQLVAEGFRVLYVKVGRGEALDLEVARQVRAAIGSDIRMRLDANEAWDEWEARRMFEKLKPFDPEFIEQPTPGAGGAERLARLRAVTDIPIAADQSAFSPEEVYDICRSRAADVIVLGLHETCGVVRYKQGRRNRRGGGHKDLPARRLRERHHHLRLQSGRGDNPQHGRRQPDHAAAPRGGHRRAPEPHAGRERAADFDATRPRLRARPRCGGSCGGSLYEGGRRHRHRQIKRLLCRHCRA